MLKSAKIVCLLLMIMCVGLNAYAQRKSVRKSVTTVKTAQRIADEAAVAKMDDFGYDAAVVVKPGSIRETPGATGKVLLAVKRSDVLSLVDREPQGKYYKVVQADTGDEGWIDGDQVVIKLTGNTETGPPLEEEAAATVTTPPQVTITNLEEKTTLRIRLNGKLHLIAPGTSKTVPLTAGKFTYYGWSPGIRPATGKSVLENGKKYNWTFRIYKR